MEKNMDYYSTWGINFLGYYTRGLSKFLVCSTAVTLRATGGRGQRNIKHIGVLPCRTCRGHNGRRSGICVRSAHRCIYVAADTLDHQLAKTQGIATVSN